MPNLPASFHAVLRAFTLFTTLAACQLARSQALGPAQTGTPLASASAREDQTLENRTAATLESLRSTRHLRPLARIPDRPALRQLTCTAAATGKPFLRDLSLEANGPSALIRTIDPARLAPEFTNIAAYDDHGADPSHKITRYSVSAWRDPRSPDIAWIGIALYWSHLRQAFALRVTHVYRNPDILNDLAPACVNLP